MDLYNLSPDARDAALDLEKSIRDKHIEIVQNMSMRELRIFSKAITLFFFQLVGRGLTRVD